MRIFKIARITGSGHINALINGSKNAYKKYSLITGDKEFSLIKWYPHVKTDVHSHNGKRCSFFLLTGPLIETVYGRKFEDYHIPTSHRIHDRWTKGYIDDSIGYHSMKNPNNKSKYSLHYYR